jgi:hypothetical protein
LWTSSLAPIKLIRGQDSIAVAIERLESFGGGGHFVGADLMILVGIECSDQRMGSAGSFGWSALGASGPTPFTSWPTFVAWSFSITRSFAPWSLIVRGASLWWLGQCDP